MRCSGIGKEWVVLEDDYEATAGSIPYQRILPHSKGGERGLFMGRKDA